VNPNVIVTAAVDFVPSERTFDLPMPTRSVVVLFGDSPTDGGRTFGCVIDSDNDTALRPGVRLHARLEFYTANPGSLAAPGSTFKLWYGGNVGSGRITG
jgi:hypothetical protein